MNRRILTLTIVLMVILVGLALGVPALAQDGGNSGAAQACQQGGWRGLTRADGTAFRNQGDCVSYAAHGGTLVNPNAYREGFHVAFVETHHQAIDAEITATKYFDGSSLRTEIHIRYDYAYVPGTRHIDATVTLQDDPNALEVSDDLGSGVLDGVIWVEQRRTDCDFTGGTSVCTPEYVENVPVEFHLVLAASGSVQLQGDLFTRQANVSGTVTIGDFNHRLEIGWGLFSTGYTFSTRTPTGG